MVETDHCFDSTLVDFITYAARSTKQDTHTVETSLLGMDQNIDQYQHHPKWSHFSGSPCTLGISFEKQPNVMQDGKLIVVAIQNLKTDCRVVHEANIVIFFWVTIKNSRETARLRK